jgi:hypothetical protein
MFNFLQLVLDVAHTALGLFSLVGLAGMSNHGFPSEPRTHCRVSSAGSSSCVPPFGFVQVFGRRKSGSGSGTVGHLTQDRITRTTYYSHAVSLALIPLLHDDYFL